MQIDPAGLLDGQKIHYPIFHDETCFHANDLDNYVWIRAGEQPLRGKSRGRIVHVSDYIIEICGRLALNAEEIAAQMFLLPIVHRGRRIFGGAHRGITPSRPDRSVGAGEGNRTPVFSLGSCCSTIELHPLFMTALIAACNALPP